MLMDSNNKLYYPQNMNRYLDFLFESNYNSYNEFIYNNPDFI